MYRTSLRLTLTYLSPMVVGVGLISLFPILYNVYISFTNQNLYHFRQYSIVGFVNYGKLFQGLDADFFIVLGRTFLFVAICIPLFLAVGMAAAMALNHPSVRFKPFRRITVPLLRPAILPATILSAIVTFNVLNTAYLITKGGPFISAAKPGATDFVMVYAFRVAFQLFNYSYIAAFAVVIFFLLFTVTLGSLRFTGLVREEAR